MNKFIKYNIFGWTFLLSGIISMGFSPSFSLLCYFIGLLFFFEASSIAFGGKEHNYENTEED